MINNVEKRVDAILEKMWKLKFGHVFLSSLFVQTLSTRFGQYFEIESGDTLMLKFGTYFDAESALLMFC